MKFNPFTPAPLPLERISRDAPEVIDPLGAQSHFTRKVGKGFLKLSISRRRFFGLIIFFVFALGAVAARSGYLQIMRGSAYRAQGESNRLRRLPLFPLRGIIKDRSGVPLVRNVPRFRVALIPAYLPEDPARRAALWQELGPLSGVSPIALEQSIVTRTWRGSEAVLIADNILQDDAVRLKVNVQDPSVSIEISALREYGEAARESLAHILGYLGRISETEYEALEARGYVRNDRIGRTGIERSYEEMLRGTMGGRDLEVDARGRLRRVIAEREPIDGSDLTLTLEFEAQKKLEEIMRRHLRAIGKTRGAAVALDPRNGAVRALVSLPGFDPNQFTRGIDQASYEKLSEDKNRPLFPRAISGEYPSGSIIKPLFVAAGLDAGTITPATTVLSTGGIHVRDSFFPDWRAGGHGRVNAQEAIAHSVNTFFYYLGGGYKSFVGMGPDALAEAARKFGLGAPLGIDLPGEGSGLVPSPAWKKTVKGEPWYIGDTYHFAIGQGDVLVTPIQMASAIGAIANGGNLYRPHLASPLTPERGAERGPPQDDDLITTHVASPQSLEVVRRGMRLAVTGGTAQPLRDVPVAVAGKTGTAEWGKGKLPHAWFVGFAPYENPELVMVVLIEQGGEGSRVAVPIAREFLAWYFGPKRNAVRETP